MPTLKLNKNNARGAISWEDESPTLWTCYTDNTGDMEKTPVFGKRKKKNFDVDVAVDDPEAEPVASEETAENVIMPEAILQENSTSWTNAAIEILSIPQESLQTFRSQSEDSLRLQSNQKIQLVDSQQTLSLGKKEQPLSLEKVRELFDEKNLDDQYLVSKLKYIMDNAVTANPKTWELMEDFKTELDAIKYIMKLKRFVKRKKLHHQKQNHQNCHWLGHVYFAKRPIRIYPRGNDAQ